MAHSVHVRDASQQLQGLGLLRLELVKRSLRISQLRATLVSDGFGVLAQFLALP